MLSTGQKISFLINDFPGQLEKIDPSSNPLFGKMSVQQMIEHFADSVRIASGKQSHQNILTAPENLERMQQFMMSDKPFKENTPNPLLSETPPPVRQSSVAAAIAELRSELNDFVASFQNNAARTTRNPFFGDLDLEKNAQLLYKHALHHLKQFGTVVSSE
jgi:hypothetical protein